MAEAYIIEAVRTAVGKKKGALRAIRPDDLAAMALQELQRRTGIDPAAIDDVVMGCVTQVGEQGFNVARVAALAAGWPDTVTGTSVNRQCGSSQQAINFAAQAVMSGALDVVVGAGVESMTREPMGSDAVNGMGGEPWMGSQSKYGARYEFVMQHVSAEMVAEKYGVSRAACEEIALRSHQNAARAREKGYFGREIFAVDGLDKEGNAIKFAADEGIRPDTSLEKLATLAPVVKPEGVVTAGTSSQISDGAGAVMIASKEATKRLGLKPRAKIVSMGLAGVDPIIMLTGPMPATQKALAKAGLKASDIDLYEVNEAFASVVGAFIKDVGVGADKVNVNGGAIAIGHPLGFSGVRLMATLLHEMERRDVRRGLSTMCIGFGQGIATIIDRQLD